MASLSDWIALFFVLLVLGRLTSLLPKLVRELREDLTLDDDISNLGAGHSPKISVIIPAKDESKTIEAVALSILASSYRNIELILVDDRSQDDTFDLMFRVRQQDDRVKVVRINRLEDGWTGKTHALNEAVRHASGDIFIFSDADALFSNDLIDQAVSIFKRRHVDLLSLLPDFTDPGFIEKALYPHMALGISYFYPFSEVNDPNNIEAALASGCFIMISRKSYNHLGGWEQFKSEITEDIAISKSAKRAGMSVMVMLAGNRLKTKPFSSLHGLIGFWVRTFYGGLDKNLSKTLTLTANYFSLTVVLGMFLFYLWSYCMWEPDSTKYYLMLTYGATILCIMGAFCMFLIKYNGRPFYGIYCPLGIVMGAWIAFRVLASILSGKGVTWRGATYH